MVNSQGVAAKAMLVVVSLFIKLTPSSWPSISEEVNIANHEDKWVRLTASSALLGERAYPGPCWRPWQPMGNVWGALS